jgi:hypothetical protein
MREAAALAIIEADVASADRRIAEQELRIQALRAAGYDTAASEKVLADMKRHRERWVACRDEIVAAIKSDAPEGSGTEPSGYFVKTRSGSGE